MPSRRRFVRSSSTTILAVLGGCAARDAPSNRATAVSGASTHTPSSTTDRIEIAVINDRQTSFDVTLTLSSDQEQLFRQTVHVSANGGKQVVTTGVDEQGAYELTVSLSDEGEHTRRFSIGDSHLETGSASVSVKRSLCWWKSDVRDGERCREDGPVLDDLVNERHTLRLRHRSASAPELSAPSRLDPPHPVFVSRRFLNVRWSRTTSAPVTAR